MRKFLRILTCLAVLGLFTPEVTGLTAFASTQHKKTTTKKKSGTPATKKGSSTSTVNMSGRKYFGFLNMPGVPGYFFVPLYFDNKTECTTTIGYDISDTYKATKSGSAINVICNVPAKMRSNMGNTLFNISSKDKGETFEGKMLPGASFLKAHDIWFVEIPANPQPSDMSADELKKEVNDEDGYMLTVVVHNGNETFALTFDTYFNEDGSYYSESELDVPNLINKFPFVGNYEIDGSQLILSDSSSDKKIEVELCEDGKFASFAYKMPTDSSKSDYYLIK